MMLAESTERPDVEERYETACGASSLKVQSERGGPADMLIAAGWSEHRTGMALLRLHSEWSAAAKPRRPTEAQIKVLADTIRAHDPLARARAESARWYANELRILALALKSRPAVWEQLLPWAQDKDIPEAQVAQALLHFLDPVCGHCGGHGLLKAKGAPALSTKQCRACNGTGTKAIPEGGGRVLSHISHCISQARTSISQRLRSTRR